MSFCRLLAGSLLALWVAVPGVAANAAAVHTDTALVQGPEYLTVLSLPLDEIGSYKITATDLKWFDAPLPDVTFSLKTSGKTLASMEGSGTFDFFKSTSERVYLEIYGHTLGPRFAGLVSVMTEEQAPVPLPGSLALLASSLVAALLLRRATRARADLVHA